MRLRSDSPGVRYCFALIFLLVCLWCERSSGQQSENPLPDAPKPATAEKKNFFTRWAEFYRQDWSGTTPASPAPARRGVPSPLDSPPFPNADWSYGGSPVIGEPDTNSYPLMTAINGATSRTKVYGWIDPSLNFSTSSNRNEPEANDVYSNRFELNQLVLYAEQLPDSVQRDHVDWGYHLTALFGTDYRFTTAKGYGSGQWVNDHHQYGFDPTLEYVDIYVPQVAQGMNLRFGRFISVPGIEAQLAPNNYIFSHSLLYAIDPFTDTGLMATVKLNDHWLVQLGITDGHDVALWTPDAKPSGTACFSYTTTSVNDNFYVCANGINDGKYAYNNLQQYDATWYHKFSKTWHMATETWYMYERDMPALGGPIQPEAGANPAYCLPGELRCTAPEYAAVNFLQKELGVHDFLSFRSDYLDDKKGQRTGYATRYTENTITWCGKYILDTLEHRAYAFSMKPPRTLQEAIVYFSDPQRAFGYAVSLRWPDGKVICPRCSSDKNYFIKTRRIWLCRGCNKQFTLKVNTIFEDSPLGLDKWMTGFWMLVNCKNGISSMEIHRSLGITQKSAWFMLQRLRTALHNRSFGSTTKMGGPDTELEADETFIGGLTKNMHKDRKLRLVKQRGMHGGKAVVQGILDRNLRQVRAEVVPNITRETLQAVLLKNIKYGSTVYTDSAVGYDKVSYNFVHDVVNHAERYVNGRVHTNGLENFWSLLKRGLRGTYVAVEPFHLFRYVDEQVFRFNNRATTNRPVNDAQRFKMAMSQVAGRRLTYTELTGKDQSPRHVPMGTGEASPQDVPF